ncbi:MAG: DUF4430 domain-containing protein [Bacillota bacterium]
MGTKSSSKWHWPVLLVILLVLFGSLAFAGKLRPPVGPGPVTRPENTSGPDAVEQSRKVAKQPAANVLRAAPVPSPAETGRPASPLPAKTAVKEPGVTEPPPVINKAEDTSAAGTLVHVAVVGQNGESIFSPAPVSIRRDNRWGNTAVGALDATGLRYSMSPRYGSLVYSIAGQTNRGMSGWMYKVNEEICGTAATEKKVEAGDRVIWWYSASIDTPSPAWEELKSPESLNHG